MKENGTGCNQGDGRYLEVSTIFTINFRPARFLITGTGSAGNFTAKSSFLGNHLRIYSRSQNAGRMQYWHMFILEKISSAAPFLMPLSCPFVHERWPSVETLEGCHWHLLTQVHVPSCSLIVWQWKILDTSKKVMTLKTSLLFQAANKQKKSCKP